MRILGIDPGLAIVGWGVLDSDGVRFHTLGYGSLQTPKELTTQARLAIIYNGMVELIDRFHPNVLSIEELFFNTNITTGIRVGEARGVILLAAEQKGLAIAEYTPMQVKQSLVGYGRADKKQVITMVTNVLHLREEPKPDDTADALAIAITHAHSGTSPLAQFAPQGDNYSRRPRKYTPEEQALIERAERKK